MLLFAGVPFALERWGLRRLQGRLASIRPLALHAPDGARARDTALRMAWLTEAIARRLPWGPNCLHRSLVLWWLLHQRGVETELRIGVRRLREDEPGGTGRSEDPVPSSALSSTMGFHAWIEFHGVVLNDRPDVRRRYATFDRPILPRDPNWR